MAPIQSLAIALADFPAGQCALGTIHLPPDDPGAPWPPRFLCSPQWVDEVLTAGVWQVAYRPLDARPDDGRVLMRWADRPDDIADYRIHPAHLQLDAGPIPLYLLNKEN